MALTDKERLATAEAELRDLRRRVDGHAGTLFGTHGNGGVNAEVQTVSLELSHHIKDEAKVADQTATLLVGEDGKGGLVADQSKDRKDLDRLLLYAKVALFFLGVVSADLTRRFIAWLASR